MSSQQKSHPKVAFLLLIRITSFRQPVQLREQMRQQQVQVRMHQQLEQQREQVRVQERGFLFCHKQPRQRPTVRPRGVIFSC